MNDTISLSIIKYPSGWAGQRRGSALKKTPLVYNTLRGVKRRREKQDTEGET